MQVIAVLLLSVLPVAAELVTYHILPAEGAQFALEVSKTGLMSGKKHLFVFHRYEGEAHYDPAAPLNSKVRLVIDAASVECQDTWVNAKDLRKIQEYTLEKMLAVEQYPEIVFRSEQSTQTSETEFQVAGGLTIRGIEKPVTVDVTLNSAPGAAKRLQFEGTSMVKMKDYGLEPPKAILGMIGTKNEMVVIFSLVAVLAPADERD